MEIVKIGKYKGFQRYRCKNCKTSFSQKPPAISSKIKRLAIGYYLNNVGIRKIAKFLKVSPPTILYWLKKAGKELDAEIKKRSEAPPNAAPDIIEFDEIYTFVQKNETELLYGLLILGEKSALLHLN
jgi:transposase-like protein